MLGVAEIAIHRYGYASTSGVMDIPIRQDEDVVSVCLHAKRVGELQRLDADDLDALVTVVGELAGDLVRTGGVGEVRLSASVDGPRRGVSVVVRDGARSLETTARAIEAAFAGGLPSSTRPRVDSFEVSSDATGTVVTLQVWAKRT